METIYLAGGCLWGVQAFIKTLNGVIRTEAGRANGTTNTLHSEYDGYAECVKTVFDPQIVSVCQLMDYFFEIIDPYSLNKQVNDVGPKYRTGVYSEIDRHLSMAKDYISKRTDSERIMVEVLPLTNYIRSADEHQDRLDRYPNDYYHIPKHILNKYTLHYKERKHMNDTLKAIAERFSCRSFTDQMPEGKDLTAIAQAAIQAPSGMNRQHWQVIIVKDKGLIGEMEAEGMRILSAMDDKTMYDRIMSRGGKLFYNAPCLIVVAIKETFPKGAELIDCGILAQNIVLAATSLGIANLHCGLAGLAFAGDKSNDFKRGLKFPEGYEFGIGVLLGYAANTAAPHVPNQEKITVIE